MNDPNQSNQIIPGESRNIRETEIQIQPSNAPIAPSPAERTPQIVYVSKSRGSCSTLLLGGLGCGFILVVALAVLMVTGGVSISNLLNSFQLGNILNSASSLVATANVPPRAQVDQSQAILVNVQPLGQLVSVSSQLAQADIRVGVAQGVLNACGFSATYVSQGAVEAGIDLTQISAEDVSYNSVTNTYTLTLPYPQLTSCRIDYIRQYERSFTTCNVDWDEARLLANYSSLLSFRDQSLEGGILERAAAEARLVLGNFVQIATDASVNIVFDPPIESSLTASCNPDTPRGWQLDANTGQWVKVAN
ncbi:MAG: DUF4230 domain-containing protein [Anaerolineae bacterium]|nr:DUF4230 domain-containing protein [Anaerolineae bacterium]